jgi:hypothetical protein
MADVTETTTIDDGRRCIFPRCTNQGVCIALVEVRGTHRNDAGDLYREYIPAGLLCDDHRPVTTDSPAITS